MATPAGYVEEDGQLPNLVNPGATPSEGAIVGRSPWNIAWTRFKRDKAAVVGGIVATLMILIAALSQVIQSAFGLDPNLPHQELVNPELQTPYGSFGGISWSHPLGVDLPLGRDILTRLIEGSWISLLVAFGATVLTIAIGTVLGIIAGYYGGVIDTIISRLMDIVLAFPLLLFAIAISASLQTGVRIPQLGIHLDGVRLHISVLIFIIGFFSWPYIGRVVRGQTLSLREREFVAASRSLGARGPYILFKELLPNLVAPILVYSTLLIPVNILFESALSFLGVGIAPPQASWGGMLGEAVRYYRSDPEFMLAPGLTIFIAVLAFNLLGDGLRDALDPKLTR